LRIPESIKEAIGQRVAQLSDQCNRALSLASVLGRGFRFDLLTKIGGFNEDELFDALEAGRAAGVVVDVPGVSGRFGFSHALVREALYERLSATRRVRLHLRAAEALERLSEPMNLPLADLASHFTQAAPVGGAEQAIEYAKRAAEQAASALAQNEAARFYALALDALPFSHTQTDVEDLRADLHARRGAALASIGNWPEAKAAFAAALEHVSPHRLELRAELLLKWRWRTSGFWTLESCARLLPRRWIWPSERAARRDLTAEALGWLGRADQADGNVGAAIEIDRKAFKLTLGVVNGPLVHAPLTLYLAGRLPDAVAMAERVLEDVQKAGESSAIVYALSHYGLALAGNGQYARAAATFDEAGNALDRVARIRSSPVRAPWRQDGGWTYSTLRARKRCSLKRAKLPPTPILFQHRRAPASICSCPMLSKTIRAGAERLRPEIQEAVANARGWHGWLFRLRLQQAYAELALARADGPAAVAFATAALGHNRASGRKKYEAAALTIRARAQYALGRTREAIQDTKSACAIARKVGDPALVVRTFAPLVAGDWRRRSPT
jgi:tetratricopeptide (TPR) repeat protein